MYVETPIGVLGFIVSCVSSLLLVGVGLWVLRRVKLPCLPWVIACWTLNSPMVALLNSKVLNTLFPSLADGLSLSGLGLFSQQDAMRQYMGWHSLLYAASFFAVVLLIAADATFVVQHWKPGVRDRVPRVFGLVRRFSIAFGLLALMLSTVTHILALLMEHISP